MAISFMVGIGVIFWSIVTSHPVGTIGGAAESFLVVPAIRNLRGMREQNVVIRLMEIPLSSAKNSDQATSAIIKLLEKQLGGIASPAKTLNGKKK
jgi:hypothetical protein